MKHEVKTFMVYADCECVGEFKMSAQRGILASNPPQQIFICEKCGKESCLTQSKWPHEEYEEIK